MASYKPMKDLEVYRQVVTLADQIWREVAEWESFAKWAVGKQLTTAIDSVGANLVEGDARETSADALRFFYTARASAAESQYWLERANARGLVSGAEFNRFVSALVSCARLMSNLIGYRQRQLPIHVVREIRSAQGVPKERPEEDPFLRSPHDLITSSPCDLGGGALLES
jgi:four helix bundle protein